MTRKNIMMAIFIVLAGGLLFAQPRPSTTSADAVYQNISQTYTLKMDGSTVYRYEQDLRLLTSFSVNSAYGETFIVTNPDFQKLQINDAYTTMANGTVVKEPANAFNEVLPQFIGGSMPYSRLREMVVTHTGIEQGSVVHLDYSITTKKEMYPGLSGSVVIGDRSPIQRMTVTVNVPIGEKLRWKLLRSNAMPTVVNSKDHDSYTWTFENIPLIPVESSQPALNQIVPVLLFGTATAEEFNRHVLADQNVFRLNAAASKLAADLVKEKPDAMSKALELRNYVESRTGFMSGDLRYAGYRPMAAQETFDRGSGSALDRAVLLTAMLRTIGLHADAVLTSAYQIPGNDFVSAAQIGGAVVRCDCGGDGIQYLDPNHPQATKTIAQLWDKPLISLGEPVKIEHEPAVKLNGSTVDGDITVKSDWTVTGTVKGSMSGVFSWTNSPDRAGASVQSAIRSTGQGCDVTLNGTTNENLKTTWTASVTSSKPLTMISGYAKFNLPASAGSIDELHLPVFPYNRTTPVEIGYPVHEEAVWTIHLPEGVTAVVPKESAHVTNEIGSANVSIVSRGGILEVKRNLEINRSVVEPGQYGMFEELMKIWTDPAMRGLELKPARHEGK